MRVLLWQLPLVVLAVGSCEREQPKTTAPPGGDAVQACIDVGAGVPPFTVRAISGPEKGQALCYV
jgi:hypothetical protein